ncbi:hypothetical protein [Haloechinothrix aidingensis]|nr:hypothetical protein [Haloechinothrix aidingensis]
MTSSGALGEKGGSTMDPLDKADAMLSRARDRDTFVVTPDTALSPMDASRTVQISRAVVADSDTAGTDDPDATAVVPRAQIRAQDTKQHHLTDPTPTVPLPDPDADTPPRGFPMPDLTEGGTVQQRPAEDVVEHEQNDELVPTVTRTRRSSVTRRLDGA